MGPLPWRFPLPELSRKRRYLVLAICCLSLFLVGMDATIINVALPSIGRDFRAPVSGLQWTVDAYLLVMASLLMLAGSTGDRVGRRTVFQVGIVTFTLGSLACSLAPGLGWLIAFRALQAIGGSMLNPVAMAIVTNTFTDAKERAKAIGLWGSRVRPVDRGRPHRRRRAGGLGRLARRVLDQHSRRHRGDRPDRPLRARVTGGDEETARPVRASARHRHARRAQPTASSRARTWAGAPRRSSPASRWPRRRWPP